jgi:phospholipid transport system substrate-binding protein
MNRRYVLSLLAAFAFVFALPQVAAAEQSPEAFVKGQQAKLSKLLQKGKSADAKVDAAFDEMLDYDSLAKESLGKHWGAQKEEDRKEFKGVLKRLVRNAYRKNLKKTLDYDVTYKGASDAKKGKLVRTVAKSKNDKREEPVSIDYLVHKVNGKWRVYDIVTEGSSLVRNYKSQFNRVIKKKGFGVLLGRMKKKLDKEES